MPDTGQRPTHFSEKPTTPEDFPTTSSAPSGDYSYTLEIVMHMKESMGRLLEAVDGLKADSKEVRAELSKVSKDIHAAKVVGGVVGTLIAGAIAFVGWVIDTYLNYHKH